MSVEQHKASAHTSIRCSIVTVSDTRTEETDKSGRLMMDMMIQRGHEVLDYKIVRDEQDMIFKQIQKGMKDPAIEVVLVNGGTGVAKRDVTIEVVESLLDKEMPGFGEIFRMLSYTEDIGSAAILSRAIAGISGETAIFSTPGSSGAVHLAMGRLILPEVGHIVKELKKDE